MFKKVKEGRKFYQLCQKNKPKKINSIMKLQMIFIYSIINASFSFWEKEKPPPWGCDVLKAIFKEEGFINHFFLNRLEPNDTLTLVDTLGAFCCDSIDLKVITCILNKYPNEIRMGDRSHKNLVGRRNRIIVVLQVKRKSCINYEITLWQTNDNASIGLSLNPRSKRIRILYTGSF